MKIVVAALLTIAACSAPPAEAPCYGIRPATDFACRTDWSGIDTRPSGPADGPAAPGSPTCACPADTACHEFPVGGESVVACALNAGSL